MDASSAAIRFHPGVVCRLVAHEIADAAVWALREEAQLTPKPGLVDRRGSGVHRDMDLPMLLRSATSLYSTFVRIADCAVRVPFGTGLRERLGVIGGAGEMHMFAATGGVKHPPRRDLGAGSAGGGQCDGRIREIRCAGYLYLCRPYRAFAGSGKYPGQSRSPDVSALRRARRAR